MYLLRGASTSGESVRKKKRKGKGKERQHPLLFCVA